MKPKPDRNVITQPWLALQFAQQGAVVDWRYYIGPYGTSCAYDRRWRSGSLAPKEFGTPRSGAAAENKQPGIAFRRGVTLKPIQPVGACGKASGHMRRSGRPLPASGHGAAEPCDDKSFRTVARLGLADQVTHTA